MRLARSAPLLRPSNAALRLPAFALMTAATTLKFEPLKDKAPDASTTLLIGRKASLLSILDWKQSIHDFVRSAGRADEGTFFRTDGKGRDPSTPSPQPRKERKHATPLHVRVHVERLLT